MLIHDLSKEQMQELEQNQKDCADLPPITYRATFKLNNLMELITIIQNDSKFSVNDDFTHNICITLVREDIKDININNNDHLGYYRSMNKGDIKMHKKNAKEYTQLIPIITGCQAVLDPNTKKCQSFEFMKIKGNIPYVRSGGEGTGLIPPPPAGGE
ncbi:MAG: hypothetical protein E6H08_11495 [Bacteroidetes bacterium]|jgi:hypothetical protein|nr:MAG: hypothetical protein E6H08_11495 [Bacteroidota bacterium]